MLVTSCGLGLVFVPLSLVALHNVAEQDSGVASSLLNTGQQVGGAIGLAVLGTVAWTTVADSVRTQVASGGGRREGGPASAEAGHPPPASIYDHALAVGFSRGFLVAAGIALLALLIAIATIRVRRQELTGADARATQRGGAAARDCAAARGPSRPRRGSPSLPVLLADTSSDFRAGSNSTITGIR